jgi:hypothetical protein
VTPIATCERYTFAARQTSSFTAPPASMNLARVSAGAIPTFGGAFVAGGLATNGVELYSCEIYDQVANTWTKGTQGGAFFMNVGRVSPGVVRLASGGIAVIGGFAPLQGGVVGNYDAEETVESLSLTTGLFQLENYHMLNRVGHTVTVLPNDEIIAIGSAEDPYERLAVLLTSALGVLSDPQMAVGRFNHTATLLFDGRVLVTGGGGDAGGFGQGVLISPANIPVTASAEVYEP